MMKKTPYLLLGGSSFILCLFMLIWSSLTLSKNLSLGTETEQWRIIASIVSTLIFGTFIILIILFLVKKSR